jgi:hypothetical protein
MKRECWIYPSDGSEPYLKGSRPDGAVASGIMFMPDLPDFKSPVDGKVYSGRAGMREHNARNDVVPVADLKGLPYLQTNSDTRSPQQKKADAAYRKELIIRETSKHFR